ncbi:hepatoma-derived growth factor-related protein 2-like [Lytechinus variegatus]|uniref:hepatoma-derived growth factor-related protein 2-like n=1 Tax=Lytechinus variegatus TaxID=7654 RepID=UPI001BB23955|nr:hepatoma-derived growth factor-related protein 2-like [Lytechinus variegatus]XP_041479879.1 hepatoma-derived growth factor-related protein 2-like [Lytechinus variegatus]XP_041479880.1 hepatoma-derived growth factor-related protein 2-like [Lytechinus variegatus]XP_041479881.1 hepatoma-derived growth factor-related protein 2-like [Lytechinus variegatus]
MTTTTAPQTSSDVMVKPPMITRKSRQYQTAVERWSSLRQNSTRSFDRLNLRNKYEEDRLVQKHRDISELSDAQLKELFRIKNEMRVALVDIARSKRQYSSKESEFESRLRCGNQSPIFKMEYRRLRKKQVELGKLCEQLQGPNSKLLASNLTTELKAVDAKATKEAMRGEAKYKSKWLAPLKAMAKAQDSAEGGAVAGTTQEKPAGNDFANLVKLVHKQFKKASISAIKESAQASEIESENTQEPNASIKSVPPDSNPEHPKTATESSKPLESSVPQNESKDEQSRPDSRPPPQGLIPISSAISLLASSPTKSTEEPKRKKRLRKDTDRTLPTVPEGSERATPKTAVPKAPEPPTKPKPRKNKKQKARSVVMKGMHRGTDAHVSRTESAHRRDRMMKKRLSDLATRTKEDIANRRSISPHEEALNSIHQVEVVARLQLARSKVGITLPEMRTEKGRHKTRTSRDQTSISLPPVNVEGRLLRELKEQRRKHKSQSTGLPKLP